MKYYSSKIKDFKMNGLGGWVMSACQIAQIILQKKNTQFGSALSELNIASRM